MATKNSTVKLPKLEKLAGVGMLLSIGFPMMALMDKSIAKAPGEIEVALICSGIFAPCGFMIPAMCAFNVSSTPKRFCTEQWSLFRNYFVPAWFVMMTFGAMFGFHLGGPWFAVGYVPHVAVGIIFLCLIVRYRNHYLQHPDDP